MRKYIGLHEPRAIGGKGFANHSFSYIAPHLYNELPFTIKQIDSLNTFKAGCTRATPWRHAVAFVCGGDVASHRFPLFRCQMAHTSVRGERLWRSVADPRHSAAWLC